MENRQKKSPQDAHTVASRGAGGTQYPRISGKSSRQKRSPRKEFIEQNRLRLGFERRLRSQLQSTFSRLGRDASRAYQQSGRIDTVSRGLTNRLADVLGSHYRAVIDAFGLRVLRDRKQEGQFEAIVRQYIRDVGGIRITQISNSTMRQINRVVTQGATEGLGALAIGKNIRDSLDGAFTRYRANTIARTETHSAASYANHQVNASLNIPNQMKRWVAVSDARARPTHVAANGTEVPLDEDFIVGGVAMSYTGDPKGGAKNVINCRCVTLYIDPDDEVIQDEETFAPQKPVPTNQPYGDATANEIEFHDRAGWNTSSKVFKVIALTRPVETITERSRGFYRKNRKGSNENPEINMAIAADQLKNQEVLLRIKTTWRHEYGHHIDYMMGRFLYDNPTEIGISSLLKDTVIADRKLHRSPKLKQKDAEAEASILAFLKTRGLDIDPKEFANRPSFYNYRDWLNTERSTDGRFFDVLDELQFDKDLIDDILRGSGFDYDDIAILFGDGVNGKGQAKSGGPIGLLNIANENTARKKDFLFFLNDLKVNRVGQGNSNAGWSAWLERHSHMDEGGYLADYMEAMSNAAIGRGHGKGYYSKFVSLGGGIRMSHTTEMMANYVALMGTDPKRAAIYRRLIERVAPESLKKMDELFDEMLEGGKMPDDI